MSRCPVCLTDDGHDPFCPRRSDPPKEATHHRVRITVRGDNPRVELRGYMDVKSYEWLAAFSEVMKPYGIVVASPADDDYDPFNTAEPWDQPQPVAISIREWAHGVYTRATDKGDEFTARKARQIIEIIDRGSK